jgi:hypothetical protein
MVTLLLKGRRSTATGILQPASPSQSGALSTRLVLPKDVYIGTICHMFHNVVSHSMTVSFFRATPSRQVYSSQIHPLLQLGRKGPGGMSPIFSVGCGVGTVSQEKLAGKL